MTGEQMRAKYSELLLGVILVDVLMAEEAEAKDLEITVDELMDLRRRKEQVKQDGPTSTAGNL
jgi:hypothetical protein